MSEQQTQTAESTNTAAQVQGSGQAAQAAATPPAKAEGSGQSATSTNASENAPQQKATAVPEKYELKLPEGSLLDPSSLEKIAEFAKTQGLSNEQAQGLLEREHSTLKSYAEAQSQQHKQQVESWAKQIQGDKDLGGENFAKNAELAKRVVEKFGSPQFKKELNESGFGNHPELFRVFLNIGKAMAEDQLVMPQQQNMTKKSIAEVFYGNTNNKEN